MASAPSSSAWSRKALNLISALHSTSGLGVRPAWYSRRKSLNTRFLYSAEKFTTSISMPMRSAAATASIRSSREEQYSSVSSSSQFFMNRPDTSWPCCLSSKAATVESTPPDMPTMTRLPVMNSGGLMVQNGEWVAAAGEIIVYTAYHQRRTVARGAAPDVTRGEPGGAHNAGIQRACGVMPGDFSGKCEPDVGYAVCRGVILVD